MTKKRQAKIFKKKEKKHKNSQADQPVKKEYAKTGWDMNWKDFLNQYNNGHSLTPFGLIVDWNNKPITGGW